MVTPSRGWKHDAQIREHRIRSFMARLGSRAISISPTNALRPVSSLRSKRSSDKNTQRAVSILAWSFRRNDGHVFNRNFLRFEPEAELLLQCARHLLTGFPV